MIELISKDAKYCSKCFVTQSRRIHDAWPYVTQRELKRLFEGDIKTDILNSVYCSISKEYFDTKQFSYYIPIKGYR